MSTDTDFNREWTLIHANRLRSSTVFQQPAISASIRVIRGRNLSVPVSGHQWFKVRFESVLKPCDFVRVDRLRFHHTRAA